MSDIKASEASLLNLASAIENLAANAVAQAATINDSILSFNRQVDTLKTLCELFKEPAGGAPAQPEISRGEPARADGVFSKFWPKSDTETKILKQKIDDLNKSLDEARGYYKQAQSENSKLRVIIERGREAHETLNYQKLDLERKLAKKDNEIASLSENLAAANAEAETIKRELASLADLPLAELKDLLAMLKSIPSPWRDVAASYYAIDSPLIFLSQIGLYSRLEQFWRVCAEKTASGARPETLPMILLWLLELYNRSDPPLNVAEISPAPGERYESRTENRGQSAGDYIAALLLPGLRRGEEVIVKALVKLA